MPNTAETLLGDAPRDQWATLFNSAGLLIEPSRDGHVDVTEEDHERLVGSADVAEGDVRSQIHKTMMLYMIEEGKGCADDESQGFTVTILGDNQHFEEPAELERGSLDFCVTWSNEAESDNAAFGMNELSIGIRFFLDLTYTPSVVVCQCLAARCHLWRLEEVADMKIVGCYTERLTNPTARHLHRLR